MVGSVGSTLGLLQPAPMPTTLWVLTLLPVEVEALMIFRPTALLVCSV